MVPAYRFLLLLLLLQTTLPQAHHVANEPTCSATLPEFYKSTTADVFSKKKPDAQTKIMDTLCKTRCGGHYTSYLSAMLSQDVKCGRDTEVVKEFDEESVSDVMFGGMVVEVGGAEGMYKPAPEFPGLLLGCVKDTKDSKYCAVKRVSVGKGVMAGYYSRRERWGEGGKCWVMGGAGGGRGGPF